MTKDGRFSYRQIFSHRVSDGQYPPGFSKADKLALRTKETRQNFRSKRFRPFSITACGGSPILRDLIGDWPQFGSPGQYIKRVCRFIPLV